MASETSQTKAVLQNRADTSDKIPHEEQILEAIDQLRRRKARPDADRICNYLLRKFSVDARDTIESLHKLIETEKVIQVDYKGNTSYRNASKWTRLQLYKNRPEGFVKEKLNSAMIAGAVAELVVEEPDYLDQGVPAQRLVEQLLDGVSNPTFRRMVEEFLGKEVSNRNLTRLANGNYSLVAITDPEGREFREIRDQLAAKEGDVQRGLSASVLDRSTCEANNYNVGNVASAIGKGNGNRAVRETMHFKDSITYDIDEPDDVDDVEELAVIDSTSNTPRSSRQTSPKDVSQMKKEECYEIILGRKPTREDDEFEVLSDGSHKIGSTSSPEEAKRSENNSPNLKKSAKTERKQRLMVRSDDSGDLEIKFEQFPRDATKEEKDKKDDTDDREGSEEAGRSSGNPSPTPSNPSVGGFRSARRKRARKVFDPSDNNVVKRKRGRQPNSTNKIINFQEPHQEPPKLVSKDGPNWQCSICSKEKQELLVACRDCTNRAHPSCIYTADELAQKTRSSWQCERCKTCVVCCETSEVGPLATCYTCDEAYHGHCHSPKVTHFKSNSKWQCGECSHKSFKQISARNINNNNSTAGWAESCNAQSALPPVLSPQVSPTRGLSEPMEDDMPKDEIDPNIPDASDWTSEQVYQYFARLFPKEADIFRHHDIDGHSLLLLKRTDVLTGLDLLLGPALKIYRHVLKLQVRRDDQRLYWL